MKIISIKDIIDEEIKINNNLQSAILKVKKSEIFGNLSEDIKIDYIKKNLLYISVNNSALKHFMYNKKDIFLDKINLEFFIKDIEIRVK